MRNWNYPSLMSLFFLIELDMWMRYLYIFMRYSFTSYVYRYIPKRLCCRPTVDWLKIGAKKGYRIKYKREEKLKPLELIFKWIISAAARPMPYSYTHTIGCMNKTCPFNEYCESTKASNAYNNSMFYNVHKCEGRDTVCGVCG